MSVLLFVAIIAVCYLLFRYAYSTETPKIEGIPEVPGLPFLGGLVALGECHARKAKEWSEKYGDVFQVRLGRKRIVFANSYASVKDLWITQQSSLISRPKFHTFHGIVSTSQGFTIGTSPWDASCKAKRRAAATALNRPAVQTYMPVIDLESAVSIQELVNDSQKRKFGINPVAYFQRYALNTSLTLNYGYRIDGSVENEVLKEIIDVERLISNFRSTSHNWQDYVPLLRYFKGKNEKAVEARKRRDAYLEVLLKRLKDDIRSGVDKPCITGNILKDPEAKLNHEEIKSICLSMVSAGLDTVPGNVIMGLGYLSSPHGQTIQQKAFEAIREVYPNNDAWDMCLKEEKVPYITALVKEVLRFWIVIPIGLPRTSIGDMTYNGAIIPAGTTFYMNAWAANYDPAQFTDPEAFSPERYLNSAPEGTPHFAYGAGSRMCAGSHLANRELYAAFVRLICAFEITEADRVEDRPILDALECNGIPTSLTTDPKDFKCKFRVRDEGLLNGWLEKSLGDVKM
ncbi:putative cytochrome P450 phenylacetate 2-hydroxylase [Choiromyces venosus 120613-1]|uniref:Putative cytochrome P450 phenylacetate 2-hydroxylase n=1 Tax=Choiromyces venosus 120613-1 TaxID=1336337 RepID=A0A3N4J0H1_9PEZI|nr:putative cytochrome P450 phenylacetate 2-hydroxylase [Choiromyces venosus 120613-1]